MNWSLNPISNLHTQIALKRPSTLKTPSAVRKSLKIRVYQDDQLQHFAKKDTIKSFSDLSEKLCPPGYSCYQTNDFIVYYNLIFGEFDGFSTVCEAIKIDSQSHVSLRHYNNPIPLPAWFTTGRSARLTSKAMLENFPNYLQNLNKNDENDLIQELQKRQRYKPKGRPSYSSKMIRFSLLICCTSTQAYKILLQKLPFLSLSLLAKLKSGSMDVINAAKMLKDKGAISKDIILMLDEMHLQKCIQYAGGQYIGADSNKNFYKCIVVFMIQGLKKSVPIVVKASPEVTLTGQSLADEVSDCIMYLLLTFFKQGFLLDALIYNICKIQPELICFLTMFIWLKTFVTIY